MQKNQILLCAIYFIILSCEREPIHNSSNSFQDFKITQLVDGVLTERQFTMVSPTGQNASLIKSPLVFAFHSAGGSAEEFIYNPTLDSLISNGDFIGIYPNGHSNANINGGYWNLGNQPTTANDVEFVNLIIDTLLSFSNINFEKSYAIGYSNGSGMVNLLGKQTDHFKAIATLYSHQLVSTGNISTNSTLSVFQLNGEIDNIIPLNGGNTDFGEFMSASNSALNWADNLNCNTNGIASTDNWNNITIESILYGNCDNNHEVKKLVAIGQGHDIGNYKAEEIMYNEIWSFFKNH
jgi:poly(3-hydroxybutyrate) depolymerase|tara:strand:- start:304 stop:1185 length:882 start_codon:yes stop_codon:yes gene_type:complete